MQLSERAQSLAISRVINEMKHVRQFLDSKNIYFKEQLLDAYCPSLMAYSRDTIFDLEESLDYSFKFANIYHPERRIGEPLRKKLIRDFNGQNHICEFCRIAWYQALDGDTQSYFIFQNDGTIEYSKGIQSEKVLTTPSRVSCDAEFNVLTDEFRIFICDDHICPIYHNGGMDTCEVELKGDTITESFNGFRVKIDLANNTRKIISNGAGNLTLEEIEAGIVKMIKGIIDELPVDGLVERLDNYLELLADDFEIVSPDSEVLLELKQG